MVGTLTFFLTSLVILAAYAQLASVHLGAMFMIAAAALAALMENLGVAGLDNLLVPVIVAALINQALAGLTWARKALIITTTSTTSWTIAPDRGENLPVAKTAISSRLRPMPISML